MGELPTQLITSLPVAAALIYVVRMFLSAQKEWRDDLKTATGVSNEVIERNTTALMEIKGVLSGCKKNREAA